MRAAMTGSDGSFQIVTLDDPIPGPEELVLRVTGCGICGSDLKFRPIVGAGVVMGHEFCGEVVAVGTGARASWSEGMRAAALPVFSCGTCELCRSGHVAQCASAVLTGLGGSPGGFAEYAKASAAHTFALPEAVPLAHGALVEPFAVGLHAVRMAELTADDDVLVVGAGPVGLTASAWARVLGARSVTVADPVEVRRAAAAAFGATDAIDPAGGGLDGGLGGPYDVVIECVGKAGMVDLSFAAAKPLGRIVLAGASATPETIQPIVGVMKELVVRFAVYYSPEEFRTVIDAFARGRIDPGPLVTKTVGLGGLDEAFDALAHSPADLKVLVNPLAE